MVLGKLSLPGRPIIKLDNSRGKACCARSGCGWGGGGGHFSLVYHLPSFFLCLGHGSI